jgi:hypothetical protein
MGSSLGQFGYDLALDYQGIDSVAGIAVAPDGTVYATDYGNRRVNYFSSTGQPLGSFGAPQTSGTTSPGTFDFPEAIAMGPGGDVYVLDLLRNPAVQLFNAHGAYEGDLVDNSQPVAAGSYPTAIAVTAAGDLLVLEGAAASVLEYRPDGTLVQSWGGVGTGPGQLGCYAPVSYCVDGPRGIAVGPDAEIYVADTFNSRVEVFSTSGAFLRQWPTDGRPWAIAVTPDNRVLVADEAVAPGTTADQVNIYSSSGDSLGQFGLPRKQPRAGPSAGTNGSLNFLPFTGFPAASLAIGPDGSVYVSGAAYSPDPTSYGGYDQNVSIQRFGLDDSGVPAPGSVSNNDLTETISMTTEAIHQRQCHLRVPGYPTILSDCHGFLNASVTWSVGCDGTGGVPSWGVALRYASEPLGSGVFYRPTNFRGPVFVPGPPSVGPNGDWVLPDGTDLGPKDPRTESVLEYGSQVQAVSGVEHQVATVIQPGVAVRPTLRGVCTYRTSDGSDDSWGFDTGGDGVVTVPRLVWVRAPQRLKVGIPAELRVAFLYDPGPTRPAPSVALTVAGAGTHLVVHNAHRIDVLRLTPRRRGHLVIFADIGGRPAANSVSIPVG